MRAQKGALALAMAAACDIVCAQSGVNISGMLDIGIYRDASSKWNLGTIQRSNIAFSGQEDLGNGMQATFKLSTRMELDRGTTEDYPNKPLWHGESTVGLKGAFGAVKMGRALDAMYANDWQFDPWSYFNRVASPAWDLWHYNYPSDPRANNGTADYSGRVDNAIFYDSPTYAGFALHVSGSPERRTADVTRPAIASLTYNSGPIAAMVAHGKNADRNRDTFVGLKGTIADLTLMGAFDRSVAGTSVAKAKTLGVQYALGRTTLNGGWGRVDVDGVKAQDMFSFGAVYGLSKRTNVYADLSRKRYPTASRNVFGTGMSHSF